MLLEPIMQFFPENRTAFPMLVRNYEWNIVSCRNVLVSRKGRVATPF